MREKKVFTNATYLENLIRRSGNEQNLEFFNPLEDAVYLNYLKIKELQKQISENKIPDYIVVASQITILNI